jgi:hypothetical protein
MMSTTARTGAATTLAMLQEKLAQMVELGGPALANPRLEGVERLDQTLRSLDSLCRETFQETLHDAFDVIADKLEQGEVLSSGEHKALELLFTGEAEYYLKSENNFDDWIDELNRLVGELDRLSVNGLDSLADIMHVQALCRDATHIMPELIYYLREKKRIEQFRASLADEISPAAGQLLARMVRDLMASPYR